MKSKFGCPIVVAASLVAGASIALAETLVVDAESSARMAIEASTLTLAATDRVEATEASVNAADAARLPVLTVSASAARQNAVPEFSAPINGPDQPPTVIFPNIENTYSADLPVSQPIYSGGAITAGRDAARHEDTAARWDQQLTALELSNRARLLYWSAVTAAATVTVAEAQITRTRRLLDDTRALREAGMAVNPDVFAAEARHASAEVDLIPDVGLVAERDPLLLARGGDFHQRSLAVRPRAPAGRKVHQNRVRAQRLGQCSVLGQEFSPRAPVL